MPNCNAIFFRLTTVPSDDFALLMSLVRGVVTKRQFLGPERDDLGQRALRCSSTPGLQTRKITFRGLHPRESGTLYGSSLLIAQQIGQSLQDPSPSPARVTPVTLFAEGGIGYACPQYISHGLGGVSYSARIQRMLYLNHLALKTSHASLRLMDSYDHPAWSTCCQDLALFTCPR